MKDDGLCLCTNARGGTIVEVRGQCGPPPVGFALFGCDGDAALVGQHGVGHHQQWPRRVLRFDLLPPARGFGRRPQESGQAAGFHVVHAGAAGQAGDDVEGGGAAQPVVAAGDGRGGRQGLRDAVVVRSGRRSQT